MYAQVKSTLIKYHMVQQGEHILVGLSGGADSVCLLTVLHGLKEELGLHLSAVHVHHGIRGEEADLDAQFSKDLCVQLEIPIYMIYRNVQAEAAELKISLEEAGRKARYEEFEKLSMSLGNVKIGVAHHMNDQAETVLFNLMRGSGLKGLGGMRPVRDMIIRPLIECSRVEIENYCKEMGINYKVDSTNESNAYSRNKIRNQLIPYLQENFNPSVVSQISRMSEGFREDLDFLDQQAQIHFEKCIKEASENRVVLNVTGLIGLHPALRKRIYLVAIKHLRKTLQGYENKHLAMLDSFIFMGTGKKISLLEGLFVEKVYQEVYFSLETKKGSFWEYILYKEDTIIELSEIHSRLEVRVFNNDNTIKIGENRYTKWFDYDKIICNLSVRNRRDGDFIYLQGSKQRKKLKDYFIDLKLPRELRGALPLIANGSEVLWIIGYRRNDASKVSLETKKILEVKYLAEEQINDCE